MADKKNNNIVKPKGPLDSRSLKESKEFTLFFKDSKGIKAKLLEIDSFNLLLESGGKKLLVFKHSVKYILLNDKGGN